MDLKERLEKIEKLNTELIDLVYNSCSYIYEEKIIDDDDNDTIIYKASEEEIEDRDVFYVTVYNKNGSPFEGEIRQVNKNGFISVYVNDLDVFWDIDVSDLYDIRDKITFLKIINDKRI